MPFNAHGNLQINTSNNPTWMSWRGAFQRSGGQPHQTSGQIGNPQVAYQNAEMARQRNQAFSRGLGRLSRGNQTHNQNRFSNWINRQAVTVPMPSSRPSASPHEYMNGHPRTTSSGRFMNPVRPLSGHGYGGPSGGGSVGGSSYLSGTPSAHSLVQGQSPMGAGPFMRGARSPGMSPLAGVSFPRFGRYAAGGGGMGGGGYAAGGEYTRGGRSMGGGYAQGYGSIGGGGDPYGNNSMGGNQGGNPYMGRFMAGNGTVGNIGLPPHLRSGNVVGHAATISSSGGSPRRL